MDLNKKQKELYSSIAAESKESIAVSESLGMTHAFAKLSEKVETINMMLIPAMVSTGLIAGEVKNMYEGKGVDSENVKDYLSAAVQSISAIASTLEIPLEEIVTKAFKEENEDR